jgi:Tfp pilus assembly protein PilE
MIVVTILGILATALYLGANPYMMRSRDTKRVTDILNYTNVLETYEKNFDTFPSNYGSGGDSNELGYCLSELPTRPYDIVSLGNAGKFTTLTAGSTPPVDPIPTTLVAPCDMMGSYLYSRMDYGNTSELALIAAHMEIRSSGNYGTGSDLTDSGKVQDIISAKKSTIPDNAPDQLYVVYKSR